MDANIQTLPGAVVAAAVVAAAVVAAAVVADIVVVASACKCNKYLWKIINYMRT